MLNSIQPWLYSWAVGSALSCIGYMIKALHELFEFYKIFRKWTPFVLLPAGEGAGVYSENLCHFFLGHPLELAKIDYLFPKGSTFAFKGDITEKFNYSGEEV